MADKKPTKKMASEVAGELRKAAKLYEAFKNASDAATVLSEYEAREAKLKKDIGKLQSEYDDLDKACDVVSSDVDAKKFELETLNQMVKNADSEYQSILAASNTKAHSEAQSIIASAKSQLALLTDDVSELKKLEKSINKNIASAEKQYSEVCERIKDVKAEALEALA